jgi:hypothetical protein
VGGRPAGDRVETIVGEYARRSPFQAGTPMCLLVAPSVSALPRVASAVAAFISAFTIPVASIGESPLPLGNSPNLAAM